MSSPSRTNSRERREREREREEREKREKDMSAAWWHHWSFNATLKTPFSWSQWPFNMLFPLLHLLVNRWHHKSLWTTLQTLGYGHQLVWKNLNQTTYKRWVWCGVVWCGVVWCGVVWCGVVWCGVVWCGVVWCGVVKKCYTIRIWSWKATSQ